MSLEEFLAKCQPLEVIALAAVLVVALVGVLAIVVWWHVRLKQAVLALKQESVRKGLSVAEIHALVSGPALFGPHVTSDADGVGEVALRLVSRGCSAAELEQYLALVKAADSPTKQAIVAALRSTNLTLKKEYAVAVIRSLCGAGGPEMTGGPGST